VVTAWHWRISLGGAALAWMGLIFYLSSLSQTEVSKPLESGAVSWLGDVKSYAAHFVVYAILAALIAVNMWGWKFGYQFRWAVAAAVLAALYGVSDEYHQTFVAGRSGTPVDVLTNAAGAIFSAAGLWFLVKVWRGRLAHE